MSENSTEVQTEEQADPGRALGTGAREAVDGDERKSYIPEDVSPVATVAPNQVVAAGSTADPAVEVQDQAQEPAPSTDAPSPTAVEAPHPA